MTSHPEALVRRRLGPSITPKAVPSKIECFSVPQFRKRSKRIEALHWRPGASGSSPRPSSLEAPGGGREIGFTRRDRFRPPLRARLPLSLFGFTSRIEMIGLGVAMPIDGVDRWGAQR